MAYLLNFVNTQYIAEILVACRHRTSVSIETNTFRSIQNCFVYYMEPHKKARQEIDNHRVNVINAVDILSMRNLEFKRCIRIS